MITFDLIHSDQVFAVGGKLERPRPATHVIRSGRVYDPTALFDSVRGEMGPKNEAEADWWKGNLRLGR